MFKNIKRKSFPLISLPELLLLIYRCTIIRIVQAHRSLSNSLRIKRPSRREKKRNKLGRGNEIAPCSIRSNYPKIISEGFWGGIFSPQDGSTRNALEIRLSGAKYEMGANKNSQISRWRW